MTNSKQWVDYVNVPAEGAPYFTPAQIPVAGTAIDNGQKIPKLFQPLTIRGVTFPNRIWVSPMCQYSGEDGHATDWHVAHIGGIISRGPGLTVMEATAVLPEGRISPQDLGLWNDSHIAPLKRVVDFAHSQGQKIAIQIAHAGRKASTAAPWLSRKGTSTAAVGGWPDRVYGPSAVPFDEDESPIPHEMTLEDIERLKTAWGAAVRRAVAAGFDVIEVHAAHGYLLHEFYSPASNFRTDKYGGSFENRIRLLLEIIEITKSNVPDNVLVFVRFTGSDWLESETTPSWRTEDCVELSKILAKSGKVDFLDVSSGGNSNKANIFRSGPGYQADFSRAARQALVAEGLTNVGVSAVGSIKTGTFANSLVEDGTADAIFVGRGFQKSPALVWDWAEELGVEARVANQNGWPFGQKQGGGVRARIA